MEDIPEPTRIMGGEGWTPLSPERLQEVLPSYEVLEMLGRGGMGAVYKARQRSLNRLVAIKVLPLGMADDECKFVERFRNEAQTLAQMNHPAIVNVYDFGETPDGLLYFVMEFVDGTDVQKMIQGNGPLPEEHALAIAAHVCDALAYAHQRGVIHRDIKPANILINQEGHVKVADFGLAKMNDPALTSGLTRTNMAMGTPDYAAPEVFASGVTADHRADLYALGVMLYQMLTGEVPRGMFKLPSQKGLGTDPRFDAIIVKAMEANRDERYQSALEVRHSLDEILTTPLAKDNGTGAISASAIPQHSRVAPKPQPVPAPAPSGKAKWLVAAAIVVVLALGGWFAISGKRKPTDVKADAKPVNAAFLAEIAGATPERQAELVVRKLEALNGGHLTFTPSTTKGVLTGLELRRQGGETKYRDLSPIAALRDLKFLTLFYLNPSDLSFLRGMKIEKLIVHGGSFVVDVLRDLPLTTIEIRSAVADFSVLKGKPLIVLDLGSCPVRDISFVKGMPLTRLMIDQTKVADLSPIRGLPLKEIKCDFVPERDAEILRSIPTLTRINDKPAAEFWASIGAKATPATAAQGKLVDLLALVDVQRDAITGEWTRGGGDLMVKAAKPGTDGTPRFQLPYQPPEEYDFEIEFTPESGTNAVYQILSASQRSFAWVLDANLNAGMKAGFDRIDGQLISSRTNGTTMRPKFLTNGQHHRSTVEVRKTGVRGLLDGEVLVTYGKSVDAYLALDSSPNEALSDTLHLGLAAYDRAVRFHKLTVREITGTGKVDAGSSSSAQQKVTADVGVWVDQLNTTAWSKRWSFKDGVLTPVTAGAYQEFDEARDTALRVKVRQAPGATPTPASTPALQPSLRNGPVNGKPQRRGSYQFQAYMPGRSCALVYLEEDSGTRANPAPAEYLLKGLMLPEELLGKPQIEWEFRAIGAELTIWADGQLVGSARDSRLRFGRTRLTAYPGVEIVGVQTAKISSAAPVASANAADKSTPPAPAMMIDWLGPKIASGKLPVGSWRIDKDGVTTDQAMSGTNVLAKSVRDAVVRIGYDLRDGAGIQITMRERNPGANRETYFADDTGDALYIARMAPGGAITTVATQKFPAGTPRKGPRTLEFRCIGDRLEATVTGATTVPVTVSATDATLTAGPCAVVLKKGALLTKVESAELSADATGAAAGWQPVFTKPEDFGANMKDVEFRDGAVFFKGRTFRVPADPPVAAIRSTMRYLEGDRTGSLTLRSTEPAQYGDEEFACTAFLAPKGANLVVKMRDRPAGISELGRHDFPLSPALKEGELFTFELKAENKKITVSINGREVGTVDDAWTGGPRLFGITPSNTEMTEFRDVAVKAPSGQR